MTVREYNKETDEALVCAWWDYHRGYDLPTVLLPPVGVVVEDCDGPLCAVWLYMTIGHGVAFPEWAMSKPGLSRREAVKSFNFAHEAIEAIAKAHDYGVLMCKTTPSIARVIEKHGWVFSRRHMITGMKALN